MNPYNQQPYGYPSPQAPGPPQPPWQAPPRRQGWGDPRPPGQPLSPASPNYPNAVPTNAFGPPLPPPPPQPQYAPQQPQYDTSQWGVKYNQGLGAPNQQQEIAPPLPPRPPSAAGRFSPQPHHPDYSQHAPAPQQYPAWNDPYRTSSPVPPPPPPRPAEYQAQIQATHPSRTSTPGQEYSHHPPSHHYDPRPPQQNAWNTQIGGAGAGAIYQPTAPPPQHLPGRLDGPLVSPIESNSGFWGGSHAQSTAQTQNNYNSSPSQKPHDNHGYSQALGFGGPSDWEHYDPNAPPSEQTPTSPPANPVFRPQGPVSPPPPHSTPGPSHEPSRPEPPRPDQPVEIGAPSPVTPPKDSQYQPAATTSGALSQQPPSADRRPSSGERYPSNNSVRADSPNGAGNIDSVIQAWNTPLKPRPLQESGARPDSRASAPRPSSPETGPSPSSGKFVDPYADLEPEFKASLKRYAAMLRKEAAANTDDEKFELFQTFVTKELRLRSLLYGVELKKDAAAAREVKKAASLADIQAMLPKSALPELPGTSKNVDGDQPKQPIGKVSEPVPAPPVLPQAPIQPPASVSQAPLQSVVDQKDPLKLETAKPVLVAPSMAPQAGPKPPVESRLKSRNDGFVMVAAPGGGEAYSPGGRPLMTKVSAVSSEEAYSPGGRPIPAKAAEAAPAMPSVSTAVQPLHKQPQGPLSPSINAPMVIADYVTAQPASPSNNAPTVVSHQERPRAQPSPRPSQQPNKPVVPIKFEPPRAAYTPFRYNAGVQEEKAKTLKPADQAYSSLRNSQAGSGRLLNSQDAVLLAPRRPSLTSGRKEHEEAFIGLIRKQSMAVRQKTPGPGPSLPSNLRAAGGANTPAPAKPEPPPFMRIGTPSTQPAKAKQPADAQKEAVTALRSLLPPLEDLPTPTDPGGDNPKLKTIKTKIDSIADQFSFIHDAVVDWDRTNRLVRKEQEAERQQRQGESEARIDELFNDNEIGYADIGELEAEFKLSEAEKKYQEDQAELESFTSQVFVVVTERLQKEIAELMTAYTMAIDMLDLESMAVSRCFKVPSDDRKPVRMTEIMSCVLALFNKIENRHKRLAEAHVERERRRKHLELTVLYTNGDVQGVKQLEKEFAVAEKMAVLHEARGKDTRANKLMDNFDRATVRGLGDNQVFTDDLLSKLHDLRKAIDTATANPNPDAQNANTNKPLSHPFTKETLHLAQSTLETLTTDSRRLLALSNEGDILLNDADYNVSIAEARVANAEKFVYQKLDEEKTKEDGKLIEEMNVRMMSVTKGPGEAGRVVREILEGCGGGGGLAGGGNGERRGIGGGANDSEHAERMKMALEKAKLRNAGAGGGGG